MEGEETKEQNAAKQSPNSNGLSEEPEYGKFMNKEDLLKSYTEKN